MAQDTSDTSDSSDSSGYNSDSSASQRQPVQRVSLAAILKAKTKDGGLENIQFWNGQRPGQGSVLLSPGFRISDLTANVYTNVDSSQAKEEARQKENSSKGHHRAPEDQRTFDHLRYLPPTGVPVSFLYGSEGERNPNPYVLRGMWGPRETLGNSLLPNLMEGKPRIPYRETVRRIYAKYGKDGRPKKCFITATGQDTCHEVPGYTRKVKVSKLSDKIDGISKNKKYIALGNYAPGNIQKLMDSRALGNHPGPGPRHRPSHHPPVPPTEGAGKSRRRLKRRNKRKTIKQINKRNKRKTIKRRFKKR